MKKLLNVAKLLLLTITFSLVSCNENDTELGNPDNGNPNSQKINVEFLKDDINQTLILPTSVTTIVSFTDSKETPIVIGLEYSINKDFSDAEFRGENQDVTDTKDVFHIKMDGLQSGKEYYVRAVLRFVDGTTFKTDAKTVRTSSIVF
ncbi:exported hypothetical protein [Tenacibaculum sp. 190524A02b]|uniref:Fibronectin type-III domain-containing protein n=1 Tax=Tenacibaculum vairaonense TaxID=3137860 RepID=A0ABP1FF70_9FLAO